MTLISLITDEYSQDPATAFELGRRWGVEHYEIRQAYGFRVPVSPAWAAQRVASAVRNYGVTVAAISPGLFKPTMRPDGTSQPISTADPAEVRRHLAELLPAFFAFAEQVGTRNIIVFALSPPAGAGVGGVGGDAATGPELVPPVVIDSLAQAAQAARQRGFQLLLENGPSWAGDGRSIRAILEAVNCPALGLTWDPANVLGSGFSDDPVGRDYPLVAPFMRAVHVKDGIRRDGQARWTMLGQGRVDWPGQLRRLQADGYAGPLTLEPHLTFQGGVNLAAMMEQYLAAARRMLAATAAPSNRLGDG